MSQWNAKNVMLSDLYIAEMAAAVTARPVGPLVAAGKLRLGKGAGFSPDPSTLLAAYAAQEADFDGYPAGGIAVVFTSLLVVKSQVKGLGFNGLYVKTAGILNNAVTNWWIDDGTIVVCGESGIGPFDFAGVGQYLDLFAVLPFQEFISLEG